MSYHQNGQYPYGSSQRQDAYNRRSDGYDNGDESPYATTGANNNGLGFINSVLPARHNSVAARQSEELFMGGLPGPPPRSSGASYQAQTSSAGQYDPRAYASPVSATSPQLYGSMMSPTTNNRMSATPGTPTAYNPADYADPGLQRHGSTAGYQQGYSTSPYPTSQYHSAAMPSMPSPGLFQQPSYAAPSRSQSTYRPTIQTGQYSSHASSYSRPHYTPPAPPPLPSIPGSGISPSPDWGVIPQQNPSQRYASVQSRYEYQDDPYSGHGQAASPPMYHGHSSRHNSETGFSPSPLNSDGTAGPTPPPHASPQRQNTLNRPLPRPPSSDYFPRSNGGFSPGGITEEAVEQESLMSEIEGSLNSPHIHVSSPPNMGSDSSYERRTSGRGSSGYANGHLTPDTGVPSPAYSDDDPFSAAGVAALQMADQQDAEDEERRQSGSGALFSSYQRENETSPRRDSPDEDSDIDMAGFAGVDIGSFAGGFGGHMSYGGTPDQLAIRHSSSGAELPSQPVSSSGSLRRSEAPSDTDTAYDYDDSLHPFPPFASVREDTFGTGGLAAPTGQRRMSFDEGDETYLTDLQTPAPGEPPDMFYHPGMSATRPLPPPPAGVRHSHSAAAAPYPADWQQDRHVQFPRAPSYPTNPAMYSQSITHLQGPSFPRSTSLHSTSQTPQAVPIPRSRTDAEERRLRQQQYRQSTAFSSGENTANASQVALDLPTLPAGRRFNPAKLGPNDFRRCAEPWALSSVIAWLRMMTEGEQDLKEPAIVEGLVALFTFKVPTMNIADAETLSSRVVADMYKAGTLVHEEEWLKFSAATMTGVIFQLTGQGCYTSKLHNHNNSGRCYSFHCQRTIKKIDLTTQPALNKDVDWTTYFNVKKEDIKDMAPKEIERQNILFEMVQKEESYMAQLDVVRILYRDALKNASPPLITPKRLEPFLKVVFGEVDSVRKVNMDHLLPQMKYRQKEQGIAIVGFSDIFREWIRRAKTAYIDYAAAFPKAAHAIRAESAKNVLFRTFLVKAQEHPLSSRLDWNTFLKAPITRLQQIGLLLDTIRRKSVVENDEKRNLIIAIEEIKLVTHECDSRVAEGGRKVDLYELQDKLKLRPGMQMVKLNLDHLGRELIFQGDLQRTGNSKFNWLETHALLFDHFFVLAKTVTDRDADGGVKQERYDVSRVPIPMDLLVLESRDDPPVQKSSIGVTKQYVGPVETLHKTRSGGTPTPGQLPHTNTSTSLVSLASLSSAKTAPAVTNTEIKDDRIMYPFRIKHLGKEVYTLFAPNAQNRDDWCDRIREAKTRHAAALFAQNAEPFRLRVMADSAFAYEGGMSGQKSLTIKGTPLDRAIGEVEEVFREKGRPSPICRARVNCATAFWRQDGKNMVAVGTDYGVFVSEMGNARGWTKAIAIAKVTQIAVLEEFQLFLLISDKSLIAYHLDVVCPVGGSSAGADSARKAPQKLSGSRDVGFFATGKMKERTLVFYKKRDGISSTFKVLEPIIQKSTPKPSFRFTKPSRTEFFRDYDEFYIPTECHSINLFHSSLAISTARGFEVLTLDKKNPWSVPDFKGPAVAQIAQRVQGLQPLGMFRLTGSNGEDAGEFLLCYEDCAVYVNKHGDVSRSVIMEFVGRARAAAVCGSYVLLFDQDFVEVRNAWDGRLRQVISGREVKLLDDGGGGRGIGGNTGTVKVVMQHPEVEKYQIVVELVLNEGMKEK